MKRMLVCFTLVLTAVAVQAQMGGGVEKAVANMSSSGWQLRRWPIQTQSLHFWPRTSLI